MNQAIVTISSRVMMYCQGSTRPFVVFLAAFCLLNLIWYNVEVVKDYYAPKKQLLGSLNDFNMVGFGKAGNVVFELISFIGIAQSVGREPVLNSAAFKVQLKFPQLHHLMHGIGETNQNIHYVPINFKHTCCSFVDPMPYIANETVKDFPGIETTLKYAQSWKYFKNIPRKEILHRLSVDEDTHQIARDGLANKTLLKGADHVLCVHCRRGDFINSAGGYIYCHENFTIPAVNFLLQKGRSDGGWKKPVVAMLGNDGQWMQEQLPHFIATAFVVSSNISYSPIAEWEFSRLYCNTFLISASASSFGWLMAYVSEATAFYNSQYYIPNSTNYGRLVPDDFFLPHWHPITVVNRSVISEFFAKTPHALDNLIII